MDGVDRGCKVPPPGWYCTREPGHDGPCAAWPAQVGGHRMAETALAGSGRSLTDAVGNADAPNPHPTNPRDAQ